VLFSILKCFWLPIRQRITYKLCRTLSTSVYTGHLRLIWQKCVFRLLPALLRRNLRSAARGDLTVPRTRTITYGSRSFAVSGPRVCMEWSATDFAFIIHHTWTVLDSRADQRQHFRDCLGR